MQDLIALFFSLFVDILLPILTIYLMILFHEAGHYYLAKKLGLNPKPQSHWFGFSIKTDKVFPNRFYYLSGLIPSFIPIIPYYFSNETYFWLFILTAFALALGDFLIVICYNRINDKGILSISFGFDYRPFFIKIGENKIDKFLRKTIERNNEILKQMDD